MGWDFKGLSLRILKLISFFIARYLTDSLRGPVLTLHNEALCAEFDGMGWDGWSKVSFNFFLAEGDKKILRQDNKKYSTRRKAPRCTVSTGPRRESVR